jgi:hypothetical protein
MDRAEEASLAWALADSAADFVDPNTRAWLCAKIGADEKAAAIRDLLACHARAEADLASDLAARVRAWIRGYRGTDTEQTLRGLLDQIHIANAAPARLPETERVRHRKPLIAKRSALSEPVTYLSEFEPAVTEVRQHIEARGEVGLRG